jgi:hypothetical protein
MSKSDEETILERLAVLPDSNIFWIGKRAVRLTFLSQQQRALNLVWALNRTGKLVAGSKVAVVGAGLAGLTAAFAAHQLGSKVVLFERRSVPLHLQRGCQLRFIHPHILDWPALHSDVRLTNLPCLNWGAGMAEDVSSMVLEGWLSVEREIESRYNCHVRSVDTTGAGLLPILKGEGQDQNFDYVCDCVILAVGFGLERKLPGIPLLSYWENDNFGRPIISDPIPRRYLVTGCGDGGLIDAIRLRINAFDHAEFILRLQGQSDIDDIKLRLMGIDKEVTDDLRKKFGETIELEIPDRERLENELVGSLLEEKYRQLTIPESLKLFLTRELREDTIVYLNSLYRSPLNLKASILNRFLIFILIQYGGLRYRAGPVEVKPYSAPNGYEATFKHCDFPAETIFVDEVVTRHGPVPAVDWLFPKKIAEMCRAGPSDLLDPTRDAMYPDDFLSSPHLRIQKRAVQIKYALSVAHIAAKGRFDPDVHDRFGVEVRGADMSASFFLQRRQGIAIDSIDPPRPTRFFDFPFATESYAGKSNEAHPLQPPGAKSAERAETKAPESTNAKKPRKSNKARPPLTKRAGGKLIVGMGIATDSDQKGFLWVGTLGCFVRMLDTGDLAILTTALSIAPLDVELIGRPVFRDTDIKPEKEAIAHIARAIPSIPSSPRASIAAGTVILNKMDVALAVLCQSAQIDLRIGSSTANLPKLRTSSVCDVDLELGDEVFKIGRTTGLTFGRITQIGAVVTLGTGRPDQDEQYWYRDLFVIEGDRETSFADIGDGGALIVRCRDGTALGILLAGNQVQAYAFLLGDALSALRCELLV